MLKGAFGLLHGAVIGTPQSELSNSGSLLEPVFHHLARDRVPVEPQETGGVADVAVRPLQRATDEQLLELASGIVVHHALVEHLLDEAFELVSHGDYRRSWPVSTRNASTYFSRVRAMTSPGSEGTGGCLFQRISSR